MKQILKNIVRISYLPLLVGLLVTLFFHFIVKSTLKNSIEYTGLILIVIALSQFFVANMENSPRNPRHDPLSAPMIRRVSADHAEKKATLGTQAFLFAWGLIGLLFLILPILINKVQG